MRISTIELDRHETEKRILCLPVTAATDPNAMRWHCPHGIHFFEDCRDCELEAMKMEVEQRVRDAYELTTDCPICYQRTYFVFPLGELLVCEKCWEAEHAKP